MRGLYALVLAVGAFALTNAQHPVDMSYSLTIANAPEGSTSAIYAALNAPPRWTSTQVTLALPRTTAASAHYVDAADGFQATWFGINVPTDWETLAQTTPFYWGNLNAAEKWSPGGAYVIHGGSYEVIPVRDNFTDSSTEIDYYLMINRPADPAMLRYRLNFDSQGPKWFW
jgi:hypothetical protein